MKTILVISPKQFFCAFLFLLPEHLHMDVEGHSFINLVVVVFFVFFSGAVIPHLGFISTEYNFAFRTNVQS